MTYTAHSLEQTIRPPPCAENKRNGTRRNLTVPVVKERAPLVVRQGARPLHMTITQILRIAAELVEKIRRNDWFLSCSKDVVVHAPIIYPIRRDQP